MKGTFELKNVDAIEATLTFTMRICDWKALRDTSGDNYVSIRFRNIIMDMIREAESKFYGEKEVGA